VNQLALPLARLEEAIMNLGDDFLSGPELDFEGLDREAQYFVCPPARMVQRGNYTPKSLTVPANLWLDRSNNTTVASGQMR
jgi:hypothetical protein